MALPKTKFDVKRAEQIEALLLDKLDPNSPDYDNQRVRLDQLSTNIENYYGLQRKVDETGKLTEQPETREPNEIVGGEEGDSFGYHFEPNREEAAQVLRDDPSLIEKLRLQEFNKQKIQELREPVFSPFGGVVTYRIHPAQTHLEYMDPADYPYRAVSDYLWQRRQEQALERGENVKRYRDVYIDEPADFAKGALMHTIEKRLTPLALGGADSFSGSTASPLLDAAHEFSEYKQGQDRSSPEQTQAVTDPMTGQVVGENTVPRDYRPPGSFPDIPSSDEVRRRSPGSYFVGQMGGYLLPGNPTNVLTGELSRRAVAGGMPRVLAAAGSGATVSAMEGEVGDFSREYLGGRTAEDAGARAAGNQLPNFILGGAIGGVFDTGGHYANRAQTSMRVGDEKIKAFERAGGRTSIMSGIRAPDNVKELAEVATNPAVKGSGGAVGADRLAPEIRSSLDAQDAALKKKHREQNEEYFNHPAYRDRTVDSRPLVTALIDLVRRGSFRTAATGEMSHYRHRVISSIQKELRQGKWAQPVVVPIDQAGKLAAQHNAEVVDIETARQLFGADLKGGPRDLVIIRSGPMTARDVTSFEDNIYDNLKPGPDGKRVDDEVYNTLDATIKPMMRDKFPLYRDEAGNLTAPPSERLEPEPYGPASEPPSEQVRNLGRPRDIGTPPPESPEAVPGIGPGRPQRPGPFEIPPPAGRGQLDDPLHAQETIDILGDEDVIDLDNPPAPAQPQPEAMLGVPRRDRSQFEPVELQGQRDVTGGEPMPPASEGPPPRPREPEPSPTGPPTARMGGEPPMRPDLVHQPVHEGEFVSERAPGEALEQRPSSYVPPSSGAARELSTLEGNRLAMPAEEAPNTQRSLLGEGPDQPGRSPEVARAADLAAQDIGEVNQKAFEEAQARIADVERRLGPLDEIARERSLLAIMSHTLGREVTKEDLIRAGLLTAGVGAVATGDENMQVLGGALAGAAVITGGGKGKKQLQAKLDDGSTVEGFSALRRQQHLAQNEVEHARRYTGASDEQAIRDRIKDFDLNDKTVHAQALEDEAKKLGKERELYAASGASVYPEMKNRAWGTGDSRNLTSRATGFLGTRADALLQALAGKSNAFEAGPKGILEHLYRSGIRNPSRRQLNISGGIPGARYGDDARKAIERYLYGHEKDDDNANP